MALITSYLMTTKNLDSFFNSLITAKAPDVFTLKFLESLEFKSSNDRLYIGLLKGLGFLDANGVPTERYYRYLDQSQSKLILAEAVREAYGDLFAVNINANDMTESEVKNKLRTLTSGKNSENVLRLMANTFTSLVKYADWGVAKKVEDKKAKPAVEEADSEHLVPPEAIGEENIESKTLKTQLHYNIQIHLPESRDPAVYDSLFQSLKRHLF